MPIVLSMYYKVLAYNKIIDIATSSAELDALTRAVKKAGFCRSDKENLIAEIERRRAYIVAEAEKPEEESQDDQPTV